MAEVLDIKTTAEKFFGQYLALKKPVIEKMVSYLRNENTKVPTKALNVLSLLLYHNYIYRDINEGDKWDKIFDSQHRKKYTELMDITDSQLNTYFSLLRKCKILDGKKINKPFIIYPDREYELTFKFLLNGEK